MGSSEFERVPEENRAKEEQIQQAEIPQLKTEVEPNGDNSKKESPGKSSDPTCSDKLSQPQSNEIQGNISHYIFNCLPKATLNSSGHFNFTAKLTSNRKYV
jgi:hypothetical protein